MQARPPSPLDTIIRALVAAVVILFSISAVTMAYSAGRHSSDDAVGAARLHATALTEAWG